MARPALTERRKAQTRREIAESALGLFVRHGYEAVSVEAIAEEAGVSLRTFYRYFSAKDEVLSPIITDGIFPESKEFLAGYWIIDVDSPERAYQIAAEASAAPGKNGVPMNMAIEVRQVMSAPAIDA